MNGILFEALEIIIVMAVVILTRYLIPVFKESVEKIKDERLKTAVMDAVRAAEQTIRKTGGGAEKKAVVTDFIKAWLIKKNLAVSDSQIEVLIESAVQVLNASGEV